MIIPQENAFTINRLAADFFPFSAQIARQGDIYRAAFCAQRLLDSCDLLQAHAQQDLVLFHVGQTSLWDETTQRLWSLAEISAHAQIPYHASDSETVRLGTRDLAALLATFSHYELSAFDLRASSPEDELLSQVLACIESTGRDDAPLLERLPGATLYIDSHDDCYLYIETRSAALLQDLFVRVLQLFSGTLLAETQPQPLDIPALPAGVLAQLWQEPFNWCLLRENCAVTAQGLHMGAARQPYSFREPGSYTPEVWIDYDPLRRQWRVA